MSVLQNQLYLVGPYRKYDASGNLKIYEVGDIVEYNGKRYIATKVLSGVLPASMESGWEELEVARRYYYSTTEPQSNNEGDRWLNPTIGRLFMRIRDENGHHWVEF